jgi:biopolymer transport protein ExbD
MTPLIDIIFQLVLFFMVSTTFVTTPGIQVDLPRSSSDTILRERNDLNVWMTVDGGVLLDNRTMSWDSLGTAFRTAAAADPQTLVILKADTKIEHGRVVGIMDLARREGLSNLAIATEADHSELP